MSREERGSSGSSSSEGRGSVANELAASQNSSFQSEEEEGGGKIGDTDTKAIDKSFLPSWEGHVQL